MREHPFSGTGGIHEDEVKHAGEGRESRGVGGRDGHVIEPPFDDVFAEHLGTGTDNLVGNKQGTAREQGSEEGGFAPRRGAQVQYA